METLESWASILLLVPIHQDTRSWPLCLHSAVTPAEAAEVVQDVMDMANMVAPPVLLHTRINGLPTPPPLSTEDESTMLDSPRSKAASQTGSGESHTPVAGETDNGPGCTLGAAEAAAVGHGAAQVPPKLTLRATCRVQKLGF